MGDQEGRPRLTETLTESFCERCGTRYEFRAPTRLNPLRKTAGFIGGLKNWVTSQDDMSDAMRDAMRQQEDSLASAQLEAFHESFNFCITCRQYTCVNCWNDDAGRCRSCEPIQGTDDLAERLAASVAGNGAASATGDLATAVAEHGMAEDELQRRLGLDAWPSSDVGVAPASNGHAGIAWPDADAIGPSSITFEPEPEPMVAEVEVEPEPEPMVAEVEVEPEPEPMVAEVQVEPEPEPEPMVAEVQVEPEPEHARPLQVSAWEEDASYDLVEPEPVVAEVDVEPVVAEPEPEPLVAEPETEPVVAEVEPEPAPEPVVAEVEPEPVVAEVEPEPEPIAPEPEPTPRRPVAPISETILRFRPREAPTDDRQAAETTSPELAARRAQLDLLGLDDTAPGTVEPERPAVLPYRSRGAAAASGDLAARAARAGSGFWEASAREVAGAAAHIGVQNCGQCGLSLSANARFCRRCGTRQAQSA
jgi:hypothetical protein